MNPAHLHLMLNHVPLFGALAVTILCAVALFKRQQGLARGGLFRVLLALSFLPLGAIAYTAYLGGQIRHSEIRPGVGNGEGRESRDDDALHLGPSIALAAPGSAWISARDTLDLIPPSILEEHEALRAALVRVSGEPGELGEAGRALAAIMEPHFVKEEELALPPLGVLPALAAGEDVPDPARIIELASRLEAELPTMLAEHREIGAAIEVLIQAAEAANRPEYAELGEEIVRHARSEEEITYPAAIVVGRYLRSRVEE